MGAEEIEKILQRMTMEEKIALCSGADFWRTKTMGKYGIPSLFMCDGPHGLRKQTGAVDMLGVHKSQPATCFPTAVTTGASWDPELMAAVGAAIGEEAAAAQVGLVLGPGANIKRNPLCGRNFEYFSEDPFLTGKLAAGMIRGLQKNGVGACLKHFACNNQEFRRFNSDSAVDVRTLREIYLAGFEIAVKEGCPAAVMCAYNKLNGVHCSDSKHLLTHTLRREWGFQGLTVTDWGGMNDRIAAFQAGCDLNMPGGSAYMERETLAATKKGTLRAGAVNDSARRVLRLVMAPRAKPEQPDPAAHHRLARWAADAGAVLLKNDGGLLPLRKNQSVALLGAMAKIPRYQGAGSSHINSGHVVSPLDAIPFSRYAPGCDARGNTTDALLAEAAEAAKTADIAVVFAGLPDRFESEGFDRDNLRMPEGHTRLIETAVAANPNTVVILCCGGVVECLWADKVKAILYMGLPGEACGAAAADLLYGRVNPSGKLTESWPFTYADCPSATFYSGRKNAQYREGLYVGYRYYTTAGISVRWPFGYGLSYTTFNYTDLRVTREKAIVTVTNTGNVPGAEIVQLYIAPPPGGPYRPARELKGFAKVFLIPGEHRDVELPLNDRSFALWFDGWKIPGGTYTIFVGSSSTDLPLRADLAVEGETIPAPVWQAGSWYEAPHGPPTRAAWETMLGRNYWEHVPRKGRFTMDNTIAEMKDHTLLMRAVHRAMETVIIWGIGRKKAPDDPEVKMLLASGVNSPIRTLHISAGKDNGILPGVLEIANGHFLRGIRRMLRR